MFSEYEKRSMLSHQMRGEAHANGDSSRPGYIKRLIISFCLDIFDDVGIDSPLETGVLTSKVIVIKFLRGVAVLL